jgi:hypothetical protein
MSNFSYVKVQYDPVLEQLVVDPPLLQLDDSIDHVVWWCVDLPKGGFLQVDFQGSSVGPFAALRTQDGLVIGSGNVGLQAKNSYPYKIGVKGEGWTGEALVENHAEQPKGEGGPTTCDRPKSGPPVCYLVRQ